MTVYKHTFAQAFSQLQLVYSKPQCAVTTRNITFIKMASVTALLLLHANICCKKHAFLYSNLF